MWEGGGFGVGEVPTSYMIPFVQGMIDFRNDMSFV